MTKLCIIIQLGYVIVNTPTICFLDTQYTTMCFDIFFFLLSIAALSSDAGYKLHEILSHCFDVESVGQLLTSHGLITKDDLDVVGSAPCKYLKNSFLLEQIDLTDASVVYTLSNLLQESNEGSNKVIGKFLLECKSH